MAGRRRRSTRWSNALDEANEARLATALAFRAFGEAAQRQADAALERAARALELASCVEYDAAQEKDVHIADLRRYEARLYRQAAAIFRAERKTLQGEAARAFAQAAAREAAKVHHQTDLALGPIAR